MKITAIKAQQKSDSRVSLYVDDAYFCSVDMLQVSDLRLYVGKELTEEEADHIKKEGEFSKAYNRVLNFLAIRPRSEREVQDYLFRKQYDKEVSARIVERIIQKGYINDASFATSWVRSRQATKPVSRRRLQAELAAKGVKGEPQQDALQNYDERAALQKVIDKKRHHTRYQDRQKFIAFLARQGFPYDLIQELLD
jgi:regulatory protein